MANRQKDREGARPAPWRSFRLKNFRTFQDTGSIRLAPLTVLFGKNSSGKTTLLRAPLLLKQLVSPTPFVAEVPLSGPFVDFGSYRELVFRGELRRDVEMCFDFTPSARRTFLPPSLREIPEFQSLGEQLRITIVLHWNARGARPQTDRIAFSSGDSESGETVVFERRGPHSTHLHIPPLGFSQTFSEVPELSPATFGYLPRTSLKAAQAGHVADVSYISFFLSNVVEEAVARLVHIGPLRDMPERAYRLDQVASFGGPSFRAVGVLEREQETVSAASKALRQLGMASDVSVTHPAPGYVGISLTDPVSGMKVNLADIGFGISQVLPILVALASAPSDSLLLIEQPELHLHPENQGGVADALVTLSRTRRVYLLVESHSEHILMRLQRRIAEGVIHPDDVALYVVDKGAVRPARVDTFGRLDSSAFPEGFFEEEWDEAVGLAQAVASDKRGDGRNRG